MNKHEERLRARISQVVDDLDKIKSSPQIKAFAVDSLMKAFRDYEEAEDWLEDEYDLSKLKPVPEEKCHKRNKPC